MDAPAREMTTGELADAVRSTLADTYTRPIVVEHDAVVAVLAGKPLDQARAAMPVHADRIVALDVASLPWAAVPPSGLQLWRQHGRSRSDGELVTEVEAGDPPVQVVVEDGGWRLVRLADGAQGWVEPDAAREELEQSRPPDADLGDAARVDVTRFVEVALELEDTPYVWGGTTRAGVDCSGIVQRSAWTAGRCWLPRHSRALLKVGERVAPSRIERGDVLVLQRDPSTYEAEQRAQLAALAAEEASVGAVPAHGPAIHPMHVAIALSGDEVLHASRDSMRVTREALASLRSRYRVLGVRRLGPASAPVGGDAG